MQKMENSRYVRMISPNIPLCDLASLNWVSHRVPSSPAVKQMQKHPYDSKGDTHTRLPRLPSWRPRGQLWTGSLHVLPASHGRGQPAEVSERSLGEFLASRVSTRRDDELVRVGSRSGARGRTRDAPEHFDRGGAHDDPGTCVWIPLTPPGSHDPSISIASSGRWLYES